MAVEPWHRVDCAVDIAGLHARRIDLEVDMRSEGPSGHADGSDDLTCRHRLADPDRDAGHVSHQRLSAVRVLDGDVVSGPTACGSDPGIGDDARRRSVQRRADGGGEVQAGVIARPWADLAEAGGNAVAARDRQATPATRAGVGVKLRRLWVAPPRPPPARQYRLRTRRC